MRYNKSAALIFTLIAIALLVIGCTSAESNSSNDVLNFESGATVDWETAVSILHSGEVEAIFQTHALDVQLNLKDGRSVNTVEPGIDDIFDEIKACGKPCNNIAMATE